MASLRDATTELMVAALSLYGERVASATCDMVDETLALAGMQGVQAVMPSGIFSRDEVERIARYQVGKVVRGDAEGFAEQVAADAAGLVYQTNIRTALYQAGRGVNGNRVSLRTTGQSATVAYAKPRSEYEVRWQRIPQGAETCDFCLMLASRGAVYLSEQSAQGGGADDPEHVHRGCVVAGTRVAGTGLLAGFEREYQGSLVKLTTAGGHELTVTPNHPVLTDRGWVRADALKEGDDLVCATGVKGVGDGVPDDDDVPPRVEDAVVACRLAHATLADGMPATAVNVDGSPIDGEVHVVSPDGFLASGGDPALYEKSVKDGLALAHGLPSDGRVELDGAGASGKLVLVGLPTTDGLVGCCDLRGPLLWGHLGRTDLPCLGAVAGLDARPVEPAVHDEPGDAEPVGDGVDALATLVRFHYALGHGDALMDGVDAALLEQTVEDAGADPEPVASLLGRNAGKVELDKLIALSVIENASCHVYNLHTQDGMYAANGIITHNCDCIVVAVPCHHEGGRLVQDVTFEGYDTGDMYDLWKEWSGVTERYAGEGMRDKGWRDAMREEKLALMEARMGRREW